MENLEKRPRREGARVEVHPAKAIAAMGARQVLQQYAAQLIGTPLIEGLQTKYDEYNAAGTGLVQNVQRRLPLFVAATMRAKMRPPSVAENGALVIRGTHAEIELSYYLVAVVVEMNGVVLQASSRVPRDEVVPEKMAVTVETIVQGVLNHLIGAVTTLKGATTLKVVAGMPKAEEEEEGGD